MSHPLSYEEMCAQAPAAAESFAAVILFPRGHYRQCNWYPTRAQALDAAADYGFWDQATLLYILRCKVKVRK